MSQMPTARTRVPCSVLARLPASRVFAEDGLWQIDVGALPALRAGHQLRIDRDDLARWLGSDKGML